MQLLRSSGNGSMPTEVQKVGSVCCTCTMEPSK